MTNVEVSEWTTDEILKQLIMENAIHQTAGDKILHFLQILTERMERLHQGPDNPF